MQIFIHTPGFSVVQKDGCFRLKRKQESFDLSPQKVESLVISNKAMISSQAVILALENNVDLIFLDGYGDPVGRVWFSKLGSTTRIRRRQLEAAQGELGLRLAAEMIEQKMDNQLRFLKKLMRSRPGKEALFENPLAVIEKAKSDIRITLENETDWPSRLIGLEGAAGRAYFGCLSGLMPERYRFNGRSRRPAKDGFNACLNYGLGILYSMVEKACILSGLDPYIGFLHADNYNKKSLVFDLIEPFRVFAEQTTVHLFTGRKVQDDFFDMGDNSVSLNSDGKTVLAKALTAHLEESMRYRQRNVKRRHILRHEAHRLANLLLEDPDKRPEWLEIKEF